MIIHFFCLCPLSLTIKLNFNISKVVYCLVFACVPLAFIASESNGVRLVRHVRENRTGTGQKIYLLSEEHH